MAGNRGLLEIRVSLEDLSLCPAATSNAATVWSGVTTATEKLTTPTRENDNSKNLCDNTFWQQQQAKLKCMTTARSPEPTSSMRPTPGDFYFRQSVSMT